MLFKQAEKSKSKLRLAIFGPSGSGKTYTSLSIATGMKGKIGVIDTEYGSASKYADKFDFVTIEVKKANIDNIVKIINAAAKEGIEILIIDSLSHAWAELLAEIEILTKSKYRGNSWRAWGEGTPKQKSLVQAILSFQGHIIATMRSKTEWVTETNEKGKVVPMRVGTAPEQGKNIEYEFDMLIDMNIGHCANVIKDRTGKFQDQFIDKPGEDFGKKLIKWLNSGKVPIPEKKVESKPAPALEKKKESLGNPNYPGIDKKGNLKKNSDREDFIMVKSKLAADVSALDLVAAEKEHLFKQINEAETHKDLGIIQKIVNDRKSAVPDNEKTEDDDHLKALKDRVYAGINALIKRGFNEKYMMNSIKRNLGVQSVKSCNDPEKLKLYLKKLIERYKKSKEEK